MVCFTDQSREFPFFEYLPLSSVLFTVDFRRTLGPSLFLVLVSLTSSTHSRRQVERDKTTPLRPKLLEQNSTARETGPGHTRLRRDRRGVSGQGDRREGRSPKGILRHTQGADRGGVAETTVTDGVPPLTGWRPKRTGPKRTRSASPCDILGVSPHGGGSGPGMW